MNTKMTYGGIGPKLALISLPYLILTVLIMQKDQQFLKLQFLNNLWFYRIGLAWIGIGIIFYLASAITFLRNFKKGILITRGTYSICRNPIYASIIVFIIPGLGLIYYSAMIGSIAVVLYINFKISIHGENIVLARNFGEAYIKYKEEVNEIIPFPKFRIKQFKKSTQPKGV